jgi:hypothetical protein
VALDGATLHATHPDPFERLIVATATSASARLVTADAKMIAFAKSAGVPLLEVWSAWAPEERDGRTIVGVSR